MKKSFTLIEIVVSMFIMALLMGVGFYTFNKYEGFSELQRGTDEVKIAFEQARNYAVGVPKQLDINKVNYFGVRFSRSNDLLQYKYFYCDALVAGCDKGYGEINTLPKNVLLEDGTGDILPTAVFSVTDGKLAGWCTADPCTPVAPMGSEISIIVQRDQASREIKIVPQTGLVYEQ